MKLDPSALFDYFTRSKQVVVQMNERPPECCQPDPHRLPGSPKSKVSVQLQSAVAYAMLRARRLVVPRAGEEHTHQTRDEAGERTGRYSRTRRRAFRTPSCLTSCCICAGVGLLPPAAMSVATRPETCGQACRCGSQRRVSPGTNRHVMRQSDVPSRCQRGPSRPNGARA